MEEFTEEELKDTLQITYDFVKKHPEIIITKSSLSERNIHVSIDYLYDFECVKSELISFLYGYKLALAYRGEE